MNKRIVSAVLSAAMLSAFPISAAQSCEVEKIRLFDNAGNIVYYNYEEISAKPKIFVNNSGEAFDTKAIIAKFENERLCEVKISPVTVPKGEGEAEVDDEIILSTDCEVRVALLKQNSFMLSGDMYFYKSVPDIPAQSGGYASLSGYSRELRKAVEKLDGSINGKNILDFYASLYDADTGMFYSCTSGKYSYGFHPNIEATSQIYDFVRGAGNLPDGGISQRLSEDQKKKMLAFLTDMYDPETGNFYHPDAPKVSTADRAKATSARISRDLSWAKKYILPYCGLTFAQFKASYPNTATLLSASTLAEESVTASNVLDKYKAASTVEECTAVVEAYWTNTIAGGSHPYSMGDTFGGISSAASAKGSEYYKALAEFVVSKQNSETGLWGDGVNVRSASAAMKFAGFFKGIGEGYRYYDKMIENCAKVVLSDEVPNPNYIVYIWNPLSCMQQARNNFEKLGAVPKDFDERVIAVMPDVIDKALEKIERFKKYDGGYSYEPDGAGEAIQSMPSGLGLCESDVDGTGKIRGVKTAVYSLLSLKSSAFLSSADISEFFTKLQNAQPTVKNTNKTFEENFESYQEGTKPPSIAEIKTKEAPFVKTTENPSGAGQSLEIYTVNGDMTKMHMGGFSLATLTGQEQIIEFDLYVPSGGGQYYYITYDLYSEGSSTPCRLLFDATGNESTFGLYYQKLYKENTKAVNLSYNTWHNIKLSYLPRGIENSIVTLTIDNSEVKTIDYYHGKVYENEPKKTISRIAFTALNSATGSIYVDNFKAYVK